MPTAPTEEDILGYLEEVCDPEIPVLTIQDLGIIRDVKITEDHVVVVITPTYSGCPAMKVIEDDILAALAKHQVKDASVETVLSPPWTTDWLSENGRIKLLEYGIVPPQESTQDKSALTGEPKALKCPQCGSEETEMISQFGSTACKALYRCTSCLEPFDYFKCI